MIEYSQSDKCVILGSGVNGLLALEVFSSTKPDIVTFGKSRYFSYEMCPVDNTINCSIKVQDRFKDLLSSIINTTDKKQHNVGFSISGEIIKGYPVWVCENYLKKINCTHPAGHSLISSEHEVYNTNINQLYQSLMNRHYDKVIGGKNEIQEIDHKNKLIKFSDGEHLEYDYIISTIPSYDLFKLMGSDNCDDLKGRSLYSYLVRTEKLDLEGLDIAYVVDEYIDFHKCIKINDKNYIFNSMSPLNKSYLRAFMDDAEIINGMEIENSEHLILNNITKDLEDKDIYCVGRSAQNDYFMDISSSINRLFNIYEKIIN